MESGIDKDELVTALIRALEAELRRSIGASKDAADYATNEEARAESKWDTQGLEASYLAAGQANKARQWVEAIEALQRNREMLAAAKSEVTLGALVVCEIGRAKEVFFVAPVAGGQTVSVAGQEVTVITPQSPVAGRIMGKRGGEGFTFANGASGSVLEVQ